MSKVTLFYITNPTKDAADGLALHLLEKELIACANIFPIASFYRWDGQIAHDDEFVLVCKTLVDHADAVEREIDKVHPYETPCITRFEAAANEKYLKWMQQEIKG